MARTKAYQQLEPLPKFVECGCCGAYHPAEFYGDCRDDSNRLYADELDERYGGLGWKEVENTVEEED